MPPYFKTEPVRTQVHLEGNRLVLTCMAEGSWPLEFKWLHNSRELTRFSLEYRQVVPSRLPGASHLPIRRKEGGREAGGHTWNTPESLGLPRSGVDALPWQCLHWMAEWVGPGCY